MAKPDPSTINWVASYPRSGNTWLRFLIAGLYSGSDVSSADIESVVPDIHELGRKGTVNIYNPVDGRCFIKTHWLFDSSRDVFNDANGCIHVLRNPMDVLASHLNYVRFDNTEKKEDFVSAFITLGGAPQWFPHLMGSWQDNALSWIGGPKKSITVIYEDLLANPVNELARVADFLKHDTTSDKLEALVDAFSFETLKKKEEQERTENADGLFKEFSKTRAAGSHFVQTGRAGYFQDLLSAEHAEEAKRVFGPQMKAVEAALGHQIKTWSSCFD